MNNFKGVNEWVEIWKIRMDVVKEMLKEKNVSHFSLPQELPKTRIKATLFNDSLTSSAYYIWTRFHLYSSFTT